MKTLHAAVCAPPPAPSDPTGVAELLLCGKKPNQNKNTKTRVLEGGAGAQWQSSPCQRVRPRLDRRVGEK